MFPHNSSSHEISTETNAFVQNSKGDVVVLEESSLSGAREGERPEHARYCDIEFINSSMMAAPTSHPKATAANDLLTVLPRQSGEFSFAVGGEACQSVAPETTKNPTNHLLTYDNNDKIINDNHNNAEHNHHNYNKNKTNNYNISKKKKKKNNNSNSNNKRKRKKKNNRPGSLDKLGSSAVNSKFTSKLLSDNKNSFRILSIRVLILSVHLNNYDDDCTIVVVCCTTTTGEPSLVRIPKSDLQLQWQRRQQRYYYSVKLVDNYSLLGSRLYHGENNKDKANISSIINKYCNNNYNENNSKSVILLSSTSYGDYYDLDVTGDQFVSINAVELIPVNLVDNDDTITTTITTATTSNGHYRERLLLSRINKIIVDNCCKKDGVHDEEEEEEEEEEVTSEMPKMMMMMTMTMTMLMMTTATAPMTNPIIGLLLFLRRNQDNCNTNGTNIANATSQFNYNFIHGHDNNDNNNKCKSVLLSRAHKKITAIVNASSSITLIVSKNEKITDHIIIIIMNYLQSIIDDNLTQVRALSPNTSQYYQQLLLSHVTVNKLTQRICVPLLIKSMAYDKQYYNNNNNNNNNNNIKNNNSNVAKNNNYCNIIDYYYYYYYYNKYKRSDVDIFNGQNRFENYDYMMMRTNDYNNQDVILDNVKVAVCYKTSCVMTTNFTMLGSQNDDDGISHTEATIFTVGALSFQDNDKSNKPLNDSLKINKYQVSIKIVLESNINVKSLFKFTRSVKYDSNKSEKRSHHQARLDVSDDNIQQSPVNIPTLTTCEPTMTLKSQSATVTSQTDVIVPAISHQNILDEQNKFKLVTSQSRKYDSNDSHDINNQQSNDQDPINEESESQPETAARPFTRNWARLIAYVRALIPAYHEAYKNNESNCESQRNELKKVLYSLFGNNDTQQCKQHDHPIIDYKKRWGISFLLSLTGGGESSLNTGGGSNWGSTPATTPNNNNPNSSGWGGTPGNPPPPTPNWATNNVNRPVTANSNQNQNQGPAGANQTNSSTVNKPSNPNQSANSQSGPPTSQPANQTPSNQNQSGSWPQGKANPPGPGQNPTTPNNNGNNPQQPPVSCALPGSNGNNNQAAISTQSSACSSTNSPPSITIPSTKQQLEQLNTMREALFSQDGWGCQHVNQDTNWDVPTSPEPAMSKDGVPMWKPPVNNGTDLWEANLRNGGQPPPPQQAKTPWGHTPSTNIGGTWGEDDEAADSSSMWTGAPTPAQPNTPQWPGTAGNQTGTSWGDPRIDPRDPRDIRSVDPREMRDPRDHRMSMDPREHLRPMEPMVRDPRMADMRGDIRGVSGRLNGASADAMWGQPPGPPHHQMAHQHPSGPPAKMLNPSSMNQWAAPPPKEMMPGKPSGWEEPSPPSQRRNVPNYDDGTSLWGNPAANQRAMTGGKVSHWKDLPAQNLGRGAMQCPPGMPQNRMPGQPMKPDVGGPMWGHPSGPAGRNGSWADGPHDSSTWDEPKTPASWNEPPINSASWGGPTGHKPKTMGPTASWGEADMEPTGPSWAHPTKPTLTKEVIWNSREFRYLCDLGYKKEDVEAALRHREMNRDEAQELLSQIRSLDWRRHDTPSGYDPTNQSSMSGAYPKFGHVTQQMSFQPGECLAVRPSGATSGSVSGSVASASLLKLQQQQQQQAAVQLQQPQQSNANPPQPPFNQASRTPQNPPSTQQLRMLVQQIQLAVQEGYLNQQILNQPLAPSTLILLNQLLQQIKVLQQLHQQHSIQSSLKGNGQTVLQISVQITKTKQQIANLQNQIAVQQATYMKQQAQQQQQHPAAPSQSTDYYKTSVHDPMTAIQNSFSDLTMNKEAPVSQQQSRLNQWKLPSIDKDGDIGGNEFSRAPGSTSKPPQTPSGLSHAHSSPNINPLLGQGDGTWSTRLGDSGWPDAGNNDATDGKDWQPGSAFTDLVPEFEPGKPWKGTQMKNIEDDPSITPGSVVRSLSLAAIKDPDTIFSSTSKTSPPPQQPNVDTTIPSLSNSTWSFNPPATTPSAFSSSQKTWTDSAPPPTAVTSELWGAPMNKARQGPPPGLGSKGVTVNSSNGWVAIGGVSRSSSSWGLQSSGAGGGGGGGSNAGWLVGSTWLLLKNLTPQIDGSTLKTLCMQHGPLQDFRLYLNHGIALTKYSSRDEASKAQGALNNCVLGNTTIFAESPADNEVHTLLQQLSHGGGQQQAAASGGSGWGLRPSNKAGPPPDTWGGSSSQLWGAPPTTNSLWSNSGIDSGEAQRTTPSSLNSYLPGDLLGGESM